VPQVDQPGATQQQLPMPQATSIPVASPAVDKTVKHRWQWSSDKQFIVLDTYELKRGDSSAIAVLGDGKLPMTSMTPSEYKYVPLHKASYSHASAQNWSASMRRRRGLVYDKGQSLASHERR
jgi:hypothetical protein